MKKLSATVKINLPKEEVWKLITDVEKFPRYVKHLYAVKLNGPLREGSTWSDWTTILWLPLPITHTNTKIIEGRVFEYRFGVPFKGYVIQKFELEGDKPTTVKFTIGFYFPNRLMKLLLPVLTRRWEKVMNFAITQFRQEENERGNN